MGKLFQRELFFKICVDRISRKPQLPRRQPSAHQGPWKMHAAMREGYYLETAFFRFASAEGIPLQCEDDPVLRRRRMVRRTRNEMRLAKLRNLELASLHRPVSGSNRRLQDKEIAVGLSAFQ